MIVRRLSCWTSGKSLYLVVFISFIIAILLWLLLSRNLYTQVEVLYYQKLTELVDEVNNEINSVIYQANTDKGLGAENNNLLTNEERWGAYHTVGASTSWKSLRYSKTAMFGSRLFNGPKTGLYLTDKGKYLSIAGNTKLSGQCHLPALGIRSVYIDGKPYSGKKVVYGKVETSKNSLPPFNKSLAQWINNSFIGNYGLADTLGSIGLLDHESISWPFNKKALVLESSGILRLDNINISGKVIIRSDTMIILGHSSTTDNTILLAPKIIVEEGFSGKAQLFATDSLLIEKNVILEYPSLAAVYNSKGIKSFCYIDSNSEIQGGVLCMAESSEKSESGELFIKKGATINGLAYCKGATNLLGNVYGSLYTQRFFLKTRRGFYENHLLDAQVDPMTQLDDFIVPDLLTNGKNGLIDWLD